MKSSGDAPENKIFDSVTGEWEYSTKTGEWKEVKELKSRTDEALTAAYMMGVADGKEKKFYDATKKSYNEGFADGMQYILENLSLHMDKLYLEVDKYAVYKQSTKK